MTRFLCTLLAFAACAAAPAVADQHEAMPLAIAHYVQKLEKECLAGGHGSLVTTDIYSDTLFDRPDVNHDGVPDYFLYNCMFGCSEKPDKFTGTGSPCPWGTMLLSRNGGHQEIFFPGVVQKMALSGTLRIKVQLPQSLRLIGNYCTDGYGGFDPNFVYEFKDGRFQRIGMCSMIGCTDLLN
jgi:hypothetical protein